MRQLWVTDDECTLDGVRFVVGKADFDNLKTTADRVWVLKGKPFFDRYAAVFGDLNPETVLEVGVFEGGSALLLADRWPESKIVGIDIREPNPEVDLHIKRLGFDGRISLNYRTSQADRAAVTAIIERDFPDGIDIVIDDASHSYEMTKQTFDIVFPFVRAGGLYIVEDWAWAHWRDWQMTDNWKDDPALSNLLFEVIMACASSSWIISEVYANASFFGVRKDAACPKMGGDFKLSDSYLLRGRTLNKI
nr:class I SAM-dependent methyltransferase [uncultured Rhodopila sp.]